MNTPKKISLIITTYNWSRALSAVLTALEQQQDRQFEVCVADDGSREETAQVVQQAAQNFSYPLRHVWQENRGFRAAKIRNRAVSQTSGDYLVFLDGDCIPRPSFVHRHRLLAEPGWWVAGNRVLLRRAFSNRVLADGLTIADQPFFYWLRRRLAGDCNRLLPLLRLPFFSTRQWRRYQWKGAKTCNLGMWKADFLRINGFDETYEGWGYEDSDLVIRLIRSGVYRKSGRFALPVFHLWHLENDRGAESKNLAQLNATLKNQETRASVGVDQYAMMR